MLHLFFHFSKLLVPHVGGTFNKLPLDLPHELGNNAFKVSLMIFPRNSVQNVQEKKEKDQD
jgi:hypothetical protein